MQIIKKFLSKFEFKLRRTSYLILFIYYHKVHKTNDSEEDKVPELYEIASYT